MDAIGWRKNTREVNLWLRPQRHPKLTSLSGNSSVTREGQDGGRTVPGDNPGGDTLMKD